MIEEIAEEVHAPPAVRNNRLLVAGLGSLGISSVQPRIIPLAVPNEPGQPAQKPRIAETALPPRSDKKLAARSTPSAAIAVATAIARPGDVQAAATA